MYVKPERHKLIWPPIHGFYEAVTPFGYTLIRFCVGAILIYHGYAKLFTSFGTAVAQNILMPLGFPAPIAWAYWLGILEFFGGAMIAVGLFTRLIALMLAVELAITTLWQFPNDYFFSREHGGYEYPLLLTLLNVGIFFYGGGRYSVDHAVVGKEF